MSVKLSCFCYSCGAIPGDSPTQGVSVRLDHCARCYFATYCGRDCQKRAWPEHKAVCVEAPTRLKSDLLIQAIRAHGLDGFNPKTHFIQVFIDFDDKGQPILTAEKDRYALAKEEVMFIPRDKAYSKAVQHACAHFSEEVIVAVAKRHPMFSAVQRLASRVTAKVDRFLLNVEAFLKDDAEAIGITVFKQVQMG